MNNMKLNHINIGDSYTWKNPYTLRIKSGIVMDVDRKQEFINIELPDGEVCVLGS